MNIKKSVILILSLLFALLNIFIANAGHLDVGYSWINDNSINCHRPGESSIIKDGIATWTAQIKNNGPEAIFIEKAAFHDPISGCSATIHTLRQDVFTMEGKTQYGVWETGRTVFKYNVNAFNCGRVQVDAAYRSATGSGDVMVFLGEIIDYGVDCPATPPPPPNNPPVFHTCNPSTTAINLGETATVYYMVTDPDGDSVSILVEWGDGTTSTGGASSASHVYQSAGTFPVRVHATDSRGAKTGVSCGSPITVNPLSQVGIIDVKINIADAAYFITRSDGTTFGWRGPKTFIDQQVGNTCINVPDIPGYRKTIDISNPTSPGCGQVSPGSVPLIFNINFAQVGNNPPTISSCQGPISAVVGASVTLSYSVSDPDGDLISVTVNWGDGSTTTGGISSASHTYNSAGIFTITIAANDGRGGSASRNCNTIIVNPTPPGNRNPEISSCNPASSTVTLGSPAVVNYIVSDPDGDSVSVTVFWGDGTSSTGSSSSASHTYSGTGTFSIRIVARDSRGAETERNCVAIIVVSTPPPGNNPPVFSSCNPSPGSVPVGTSATITYGVSDPDGDSITVSVSWGDGFTTIGGSGSASHAYSSPGTYSVTITATDSRGLSASRSCGVIVVTASPPPGNNPPSISSCTLSSSSITVGGSTAANYVVSDPDGDSITNTLSWGDGSTTTSGSSSASHTYSSTGTFGVTLTSTDSRGASSSRNCGSVAVSSGGGPLTSTGTAKLKITDVDVKVDGKTSNNLDDNDRIGREAKPQSKIEFKVTVENLFNRSSGIDIEDIKVTVTIEGVDEDGDDLEEESNEFDLRPEDDKTSTLRFELPLNIEEGSYDVSIEAEGEDENGNDHQDQIDLELEVEREKHDLRFLRANLNKAAVNCTETFMASYEILNLGQEDEDDAIVEIKSGELGIDFSQKDIALESGADNNVYRKSQSLRIGKKVADGTYSISFSVHSDDGSFQDTKQVPLNIQNCGIITAQETKTTRTNFQLSGTEYVEKTIQIPIIEILFGGRNRNTLLLLISTFILSIFFLIVAMVAMVRSED